MRRVKAGVIGAGLIGPIHVEALRRLGFVDVIALAEADKELAESKAEQMNIEKAYGDFRELLEDPEVEVVHNCTPNFLHFQITKAALEADKDVVSEKPLAMTSSQSAELVNLAKKKGLVNALDFNYRYYPLIQQARRMAEKNEIGEIYTVHGSYLQDWLYLDTDYNWRLEPERGGESRAVADIGSHWCDLIQFITGAKITSVYGDLATIHPIRKKPLVEVETYAGKELKPGEYEEIKITTEDYATVLLRFDNGARGAFTLSQVSAGRKNRFYFEIDGSKKAIAWNQERPNEMWIGYREKPNEILVKDPSLLDAEAKGYADYPGGHPEGYSGGIKHFLKNVYSFIASGKNPNRDKPNFSTFLDGHHEILICEAVLESSRKKVWIDVKC
ncbi:MAG: Gfo/Idh/MocA family oxidoreductase [Candidatus Latescibacteria bacterium]|nr:Gfo/Idh/MocA family oxidoreductase [Candidatus Latescibacterota bacterium]